jgi:PAS domain S-box-containing protein
VALARSHKALLLASVLGPILLFAAFAWWSWDRLQRESAEHIARHVDVLHEHAAKLFQAQELVLARVIDRVGEMSWDEVDRREAELHAFFRRITDEYKEVDSIFVADAAGELRAMSRGFPVPMRTQPAPTAANIADRQYFRTAAERDGFVVAGPLRGRVSGTTIFNVARRLPSRDGAFRGVAVLVVSPRYLVEFWQSIAAGEGNTVSLVREDGTVLARYPEVPFTSEDAPPRFSNATVARMRELGSGHVAGPRSPIDGRPRTIGFRKLAGQPIYLAYAVDVRNITREWYPMIAAFGVLALAAMIALLLTSRAVVRGSRGEAEALARANEAAASLRTSEARHRSLYEKTPVPMHELDIATRIITVSERWLELLLYTREEVIGRPILDFQTGETSRAFREEGWPRLLETGEVLDLPRRYLRKDGKAVDVLVSARVERDADGKFLRVLGVLVDVTEKNRIAEALHQSQKMEAIGQMTGGVAHDFNNLLTVVLGNLERITKMGDLPERARQAAAGAFKAAQRGALLTQQLLSFSRRQTLRPAQVNVNGAIEDFAPIMRQAAGGAVELDLALTTSLPHCRVDSAQFQAALLNLVVNARDAMPRGGRITIETRDGSSPEGSFVCVTVADSGSGMSADVRERALEPFFTTKEVGKGSGLGLSMVYGFVTQSGGRIELDSEPGAGTRVSLFLPYAAVAAEAGVLIPGDAS